MFLRRRGSEATPRRKKMEGKDIVNLAGVAVVDAQSNGE
jgi:hypothetical protein